MRAVVQRVGHASVAVDGVEIARIGRGLLVLVGVAEGDADADATWLADKIRTLRIFPDDDGAMNRSLEDVDGAVLVVSQFTLLGDARKGRRPSFIRAAEPSEGRRLCDRVADALREHGLTVGQGEFGADMAVELLNDGPVTILLDSAKTF